MDIQILCKLYTHRRIHADTDTDTDTQIKNIDDLPYWNNNYYNIFLTIYIIRRIINTIYYDFKCNNTIIWIKQSCSYCNL